MQRERLNQILREYRGLMLFISLMLIFRSACADWMTVPTASMNPTIIEGDRILVNKHAYGWRVPFTMMRITHGDDPQRGEIAVFYSPADGKRLVKRVIGVPGDTIEMRDEVLLINGQPQTYLRDSNSYALSANMSQYEHVFFTEQLQTLQSRIDHTVMLLPDRLAMRNFGPVKVTADHYFMMGDNRDDSGDSRYFGLASRDTFVGRANKIVASLNPDKWYLPRGDRFWHELN
ncbi:MAG: signal peptidase I [Steroidobacter sp.]